MADRLSSVVEVERPGEHPASVAWARLGARSTPVAIQILKENWKTLAYRLVGCGPDGGDVVATRHATLATLVERRIYTELLPRTSVPRLRLHGVLDETDGSSWMFLDDAGDTAPDLRGHTGRVLAAMWLGRLHRDLAGTTPPEGLPERGADDALRALQASRVELGRAMVSPHIEDAGHGFVDELDRRLAKIERAWDGVLDQTADLPSTLVHADFVAKNLRIREEGGGGRSVVAFDWEMSGWGSPLRDLALIDIGAYAELAAPIWGARVHDLDRLADVGRLLSLLASIEWEMLGLLSEWPRRYLARLRIFHERLATAAARVGLSVTTRPSPDSTAAPRDPDAMDRRTVATGLRSMEPHGPIRIVEVLDQTPNVYRSTDPSAIVRCAFDDGIDRSVFVKRHVPGIHAGGPFWAGGAYEVGIYRDILAARDTGTPAYHGSWSDPDCGDTYLAIEYVEGWRLGRSDPAWLVEAARWLARLHRDLTPTARRHPSVRAYDEPYYTGWSAKALAAVRAADGETGWLEPLARTFDEVMAPRLAAAEASFIHGEPYPENLIVSDGRLRAVDWQSAAIGPAAIDLACVTEGSWRPALVAESEAAYAAERWPDGQGGARFKAELEAARLYWSMRWLGTDVDVTTISRRATYIASLRRSAERLGLVAAVG